MIELEMDGFVLQVPVKPKMTISELMDVIEKVEHIARANERGMHARETHNFTIQSPNVQAPPAPTAVPLFVPAAQITPPLTEEFKTHGEDGAKVQHLSNQVRSHVDHLRRHEDVLVRHEKHLGEILQYLQSLDKYIRR